MSTNDYIERLRSVVPDIPNDLVGKDVDEVVNYLTESLSDYNVIKHDEKDAYTLVFKFHRIRVLYNSKTNKVVKQPKVG